MTYEYKVFIPKERIGVLIGDKGTIKRLIERRTNCSLIIHNDEVSIISDESYNAWICQQVVKAIGRGFKPSEALLLINEGYVFELIDIMDYARNQNDKFRLRGRVIGENGLTRKRIEDKTNCHVSVFGKTIGIIGSQEDVSTASEAIIMLLNGAQVNTVIKFLDKKRKMKIKKQFL